MRKALLFACALAVCGLGASGAAGAVEPADTGRVAVSEYHHGRGHRGHRGRGGRGRDDRRGWDCYGPRDDAGWECRGGNRHYGPDSGDYTCH